MDSAFGVELEAPLPPPKSGISPSLHTSPRECTGQGIHAGGNRMYIRNTEIDCCVPLPCSCNANPETVIRVLLVIRILMCMPPYDTGLNSGHKVCFKQESPLTQKIRSGVLPQITTYHTAPM